MANPELKYEKDPVQPEITPGTKTINTDVPTPEEMAPYVGSAVAEDQVDIKV